MALTSGLAIYFILWWVVLFTVLPWGADSAHERGEEAEPGHAASAPINPNLGRKFIITTLLSTVLFAIGYVIVEFQLIPLDSVFSGPRVD